MRSGDPATKGNLETAAWLACGVVLGAGLCGMVMRGAGRMPAGSLKKEAVRLEPQMRGAGGSGELESADARESRMATRTLATENAELRREVMARETHVRNLTEALAATRAEADQFRSHVERAELGSRTGVGGSNLLARDDLRVLDADPGLRMVILGGGADRGVRPGMVFDVVRSNRVVGSARTVDVRPGVAGAFVEEWKDGLWPAMDDKAVLRRSADR